MKHVKKSKLLEAIDKIIDSYEIAIKVNQEQFAELLKELYLYLTEQAKKKLMESKKLQYRTRAVEVIE
jgi:hypothetical protein